MYLRCAIFSTDHVFLFCFCFSFSEKSKSSSWLSAIAPVVAIVIIVGLLVYILRKKFAAKDLLDMEKKTQTKGAELSRANVQLEKSSLPVMGSSPSMGALPPMGALPTEDVVPFEMTENPAYEIQSMQPDHVCEMTSNVAYGTVIPVPVTTTVVEVPASDDPGYYEVIN